MGEKRTKLREKLCQFQIQNERDLCWRRGKLSSERATVPRLWISLITQKQNGAGSATVRIQHKYSVIIFRILWIYPNFFRISSCCGFPSEVSAGHRLMWNLSHISWLCALRWCPGPPAPILPPRASCITPLSRNFTCLLLSMIWPWGIWRLKKVYNMMVMAMMMIVMAMMMTLMTPPLPCPETPCLLLLLSKIWQCCNDCFWRWLSCRLWRWW